VSARYRIGTTSFIHPVGWLENARRLAGRVQDVEIVIFEAGASNAPPPEEIAALARLGGETGLTWSVHTPLGFALASEDAVRRRAAVEAVSRTVQLTAPLSPHAVIVHLAPGEREGDPLPRDPAAFRRRAAASLREVLDATRVAPATLCLETLEYDFALAEPIVEELGLSVALDLGHLARDGVPFDAVVARNLHRAPIVQWHGTDATGRDHRSLRHYPRADALRLVRTLRDARWAGVLTLEVFREADLEDSLTVLAELEREVAA
jgi:sugar phosphate isomerase/epimerase